MFANTLATTIGRCSLCDKVVYYEHVTGITKCSGCGATKAKLPIVEMEKPAGPILLNEAK